MKVIDAHTGLEVKVGMRIPLPMPGVFSTPESSKTRAIVGLTDYYYEVVDIHPGMLKASMDMIICENGQKRFVMAAPLQVRWTHPNFFMRHIAFVPT